MPRRSRYATISRAFRNVKCWLNWRRYVATGIRVRRVEENTASAGCKRNARQLIPILAGIFAELATYLLNHSTSTAAIADTRNRLGGYGGAGEQATVRLANFPRLRGSGIRPSGFRSGSTR